ncbi:unnamed protein product [Cuscuta campestris]|uniref:DUF4283 domain-containing protein n=1 Tax=Cuscuta campestris TaxID=132261 RepID=A0A484KHW6_9ASTE|nr:unnamed protein product [Cuscuta campestris]
MILSCVFVLSIKMLLNENLIMEKYQALYTLASRLGKPLMMDEYTANRDRRDSARVCLELDLSQPPPPKIHIRMGGKDIFVDCTYENRPCYCTTCKKIGHSSTRHTTAQPTEKVPSGKGKEGIPDSNVNKWIKVTSKKPKGTSHVAVKSAHNVTKPGPTIYEWKKKEAMGWFSEDLTRLDRILINHFIQDFYDDIVVNHLSKTSLDHSPLVITCSFDDFSGPKPFRFLDCWTTHEQFLKVVKESWGHDHNHGGMYGLGIKLKRLKKALNQWNKEVFGNIFDNLKMAEDEAQRAQDKYQNDPSPINRSEDNKAKAMLIKATNQEYLFWRQKANLKWLQKVLPKIISKEQTGFQQGKGIDEQIILVKEMVHKIDAKDSYYDDYSANNGPDYYQYHEEPPYDTPSRSFGYSPYQDNCGDYDEPHGDQDDYDEQGPMYDDQLDPLIEEILWTEEKILNLDLALVMECSLFEPPYCRDYSLSREEQIEANRDAIQARERFLKTVQEERQLLQTQKDNEQREYWEHMQKMLVDFKKAMEQQEEMEEIVVLEEDEESETESETESNNVSILEYPQTPSSLYIENKITLAEMIARDVLYGEIDLDEGVCEVYDHVDELIKTLRSFRHTTGPPNYDSDLHAFDVEISCFIQDLVRDPPILPSLIPWELQNFRTNMLGAIKILIDTPPFALNVVSTVIKQNAEAHDHTSKEESTVGSQDGDEVDIGPDAINKHNGRSNIVEKNESHLVEDVANVNKLDPTFQEFYTSAGVVIEDFNVPDIIDKVADADNKLADIPILSDTIKLFDIVTMVKTEHLVSPRATAYAMCYVSYFHHFAARAKMVEDSNNTSLDEPVLEKFEPTTDPLDSNTDEADESIDEKIPCDAELISSIETITEDSEEGHSVIIEPSTESQLIEDFEGHVLAIKANDVYKPRRLTPPPIQDESPPFFLLPPCYRNESKILDFDYKRTEQRWHQNRVKKVEFGIRSAGEPFLTQQKKEE